MIPLIIILVIGISLVVVIWKFSNTKSTSFGIDVVTGNTKKKNYDIEAEDGERNLKVEETEQSESMTNKKIESSGDIKKLSSGVEEDCIQMIVKNPKDINAYLRLSVFYMQRKKWLDAKEVLLEAKKIEDENDKVLNNLGIVWYKLKRYNNAISVFERAIKLNDKIAHRYINLGLCFSALSDHVKAADCFSKAVSLDPEHRDYQDLLAEAKSMLV
ncbi:MAG TPA: tetratricopeptide repeat protein [bacterium]|nr:tetratricopeptide repeat protein [bacterium]